MKFTTKVEYGLVCLVYMARNAERWISIQDIVVKERFSRVYIQKILQRLRAANIVTAHHGKQGGYALASHPSKITLKAIIEALDGRTFDIYCQPRIREQIVCTHFSLCGVRPVWAKTKQLLDDFFNSITLETMAKNEKDVFQMIGGKESHGQS